MCILTKEWLFENYGSRKEGQKEQTKEWLLKYGKDVPPHKLDEWANWKHLSEYQVNTNDIVDKCLDMIGKKYPSELYVHRLVNLLRVPYGFAYDNIVREYKPKNILELGVGGDSAISTAIFLAWIEESIRSGRWLRPQELRADVWGEGDGGARVCSVDRNPLDTTWLRYNKYPFWQFIQGDSVNVLNDFAEKDVWWEMIFIDTIHSYTHTIKELDAASKITNLILCDDATFPGNDFDPEPGGVKKAIEEWLKKNQDWEFFVCFGYDSVGFLKRKHV